MAKLLLELSGHLTLIFREKDVGQAAWSRQVLEDFRRNRCPLNVSHFRHVFVRKEMVWGERVFQFLVMLEGMCGYEESQTFRDTYQRTQSQTCLS